MEYGLKWDPDWARDVELVYPMDSIEEAKAVLKRAEETLTDEYASRYGLKDFRIVVREKGSEAPWEPYVEDAE